MFGHSHGHGPGGHSHGGSGHALPDHFKGAGEVRAIPRLLHLVAPECALIVCAALALFVSAGINLVLPYAIGLLIDRQDSDSRIEASLHLLGILAGVFVVGALFTAVRGYLFALAGERVVRRIRAQLFAAIVCQDVAFFDVHRTGDLTNRLSVDTMMIQQAATITIGFMMRFLIQIVGGIIMLFTLSWELTLFMMLPLPIMLCAGLIYGRFARRLQARVQTALGRTTETAEQSIGSIRLVRAFGQEAHEQQQYDEAIDVSFALGKSMALYSGLFQGGVEFVAYVAILCVVGNGVRLLARDAITPGELSSFLLVCFLFLCCAFLLCLVSK